MSTTTFKGLTYDPARDEKRLGAQLRSVISVMRTGNWLTLSAIAGLTDSPEASVSARLRDMRRLGWTVDRRHLSRGLWTYRAVFDPPDDHQLSFL